MKKLGLVLLIVFAFLSYFQVLSSPFEFIQESIYLAAPYGIKGFVKGGIFIAVYLIAIVAIFLAFFVRSKITLVLLLSFITLAYTGDFFVQHIGSSNTGISQSVFTLSVSEASRAGDMWLFRTDILQSFLLIAVFIVGLLFVRGFVLKDFRVSTLFSIVSILVASILVYLSSYFVFSIVKQSYPAPIKLLAIAAEYVLTPEPPERVLDSSEKPVKESSYKDIVWFIDESVGGQYLSVNGYSKETTPFLKNISQSSDFKNMGVVPSISNCSGPSNLLLRIGLTYKKSSNFKNNLENLPTIFQYAKRAGFKTYLIDAQIAEGGMQNHLTTHDLKNIDQYITLNRSFLPNKRDKEGLRIMNEALSDKSGQKKFIVMVKWGSHWPYAEAYPENKQVFKPANSTFYTEMNAENKEMIMNSYYNSLRYGVDDFLKNLLKGRDLSEQVFLYTSDHGQNLYQNNGITLTHCHQTSSNQEPVMVVFRVPFMVFTKNAKELFSSIEPDQVAQEQMFATTLQFMGYPDKLVQSYGPTLFKKPKVRKIREIFSTQRYLDYQSKE